MTERPEARQDSRTLGLGLPRLLFQVASRNLLCATARPSWILCQALRAAAGWRSKAISMAKPQRRQFLLAGGLPETASHGADMAKLDFRPFSINQRLSVAK